MNSGVRGPRMAARAAGALALSASASIKARAWDSESGGTEKAV